MDKAPHVLCNYPGGCSSRPRSCRRRSAVLYQPATRPVLATVLWGWPRLSSRVFHCERAIQWIGAWWTASSQLNPESVTKHLNSFSARRVFPPPCHFCSKPRRQSRRCECSCNTLKTDVQKTKAQPAQRTQLVAERKAPPPPRPVQPTPPAAEAKAPTVAEPVATPAPRTKPSEPPAPAAAPSPAAPSRQVEKRISTMNEAQIMDKLRSVVSADDPSTMYAKIKKVGQGYVKADDFVR